MSQPLHRLLLRLYPASFRNEYGPELGRVFERRRRDARGPVGIVALWLGEIADVTMTAAQVHFDVLRQDLRFARRSLSRSRGFAAATIAVTALGVGATTAVFSVADHVLVRPLPYAQPDRLVKIWQSQPNYSRIEASPANFRDWQRMTTSFTAMGSFTEGQSSSLVGVGEPVKLNGSDVSANTLPILGVPPAMGRLFTADDDSDAAASAIVISDGVWRNTFGADPAIIGRKVSLDNYPTVVIGVMPPSFQFPSRTTDIWRLLRLAQTSMKTAAISSARDRAAETGRVARTGPHRDGDGVGAARARVSKENAKIGATLIDLRDEVNAVAADADGADGRGRMCAADRLHEPREPARRAHVVARTRWPCERRLAGRERWCAN
jgi:putative ABC transport system permease protein